MEIVQNVGDKISGKNGVDGGFILVDSGEIMEKKELWVNMLLIFKGSF